MRLARCLPLLLLLAACAASPPKAPPAPAPPPPPPPLDASYDWHGLLLAPFGTTVKDIPFKLHEVLLFSEQAGGGDGAECYGLEREAPRFVERTPDQYSLCFRHDHLARIEATVNVPQASAGQIFADACGLWQKNAALSSATTLPEAARSDCTGHDGGIAFRGSLDEESEDSDQPFSIRLDGPEQP